MALFYVDLGTTPERPAGPTTVGRFGEAIAMRKRQSCAYRLSHGLWEIQTIGYMKTDRRRSPCG
ncbi:hypothetical protein H6F90_03890 [Trichocoleus sp. FACHB-591]|uniref:hypothetical protein n=1 Tax=Trichocoleus sp. FACHB-591 TaxID=2692872 RepID=UPI001685A36D|nr:hypothetical protein [Trichocoleus sp. FACHB-591]MBD2094289.1 hypothetical protein [Trichocoleus sp. FACHB-591]